MSIYDFYYKNNINSCFIESFNLSSTIPTETSDFERGKLNTYPYLPTDLTREYILKICQKYSPSFSVDDIKLDKELSRHSNIWLISSGTANFIAQNIYTIINKNKLWNSSLKNEIISSEKRMQSILYSSRSTYTINLLIYDEKTYFCLMHQYESVDIFKDFSSVFEAMKLVKCFNLEMMHLLNIEEKKRLLCEKYNCNLVTVYGLYKEITNFSDILHSEYYNELHSYLSILEKYFNNIILNSDMQVTTIHYGKSLLNHVVHTSAGNRLLPSDSIFQGEVGYDAAFLLIEYWCYNNVMVQETIYRHLCCSVDLYHISIEKMSIWCILILLIKIEQELIFLLKPDFELYRYLLNILFNILEV